MQVLRHLSIPLCVVLVCLAVSAGAGAHAHFVAGFPADGATVTAKPTEVILQFSEPIEIRFSTFKVYPLLVDEDDPVRLRSAAGALVSEVLRLRDDADRRADAGVTTTARSAAQVTIALKENLAPGTYVVMWSVLSVDTHTAQGFYVFRYQPE